MQHAFRKSNFCADFLAKLGAMGITSILYLEVPPAGLFVQLNANMLGVSFVRP